jgi:hypothetical protein
MKSCSPEDSGEPDWPLEVGAMHLNGNDVWLASMFDCMAVTNAHNTESNVGTRYM